MIPKIIHQIWIQGYNSIPDNLKKIHLECIKINTNFKFIFWDNNKIIKFIKEHYDIEFLDIYNNYNIMAQKADFARYLILYIYGGIYLDMDMICKKNLNTFLKYNFFITEDNLKKIIHYKQYPNGIIGSIPYHPLFKIIFINLKKRVNEKNNIPYSTGTRLLYDSIIEYKGLYKDDITIIDPQYLHPCPLYSNKECENNCKKCYVVHTGNLSWSPMLKYISYIAKYKQYILIIVLCILLYMRYKSNI